MNIFRDISIRKKLLIPPIIMVITLVIILFIAITGLGNQRKVLSHVQEITLKRLHLVNEFITASRHVQSDVHHLSVLKFMQAPEIEILPVSESLSMGLAVVYGIVKHHKGAIRVETKPGKGTVFEVLFPQLQVETKQETS